MKKIFFVIGILLTLSSCHKIIEVDYPEFESKLVINSFFCPDSVFRVFVSKTTNFNDSNVYFIDNATCKLYADDKYLFDFIYQDTGFYVAPDNYKPIVGVKYKIEVSTKNLSSAWAEDSIPVFMPRITSVSVVDSAEYQTDEYILYLSELSFSFEDNLAEKNYFEMEMQERDDTLPFPVDTIVIGENDTIFSVGYMTMTLSPRGNDPVIVNEGLIDFQPVKYPFSDELFNGQLHNFKILFCPNVFEENDVQDYADYTFFIKLRSVSEAYYHYRKKLILHINNQEGDFWTGTGAPVQMYSNVHNGYGIFAGYQEVVDSVRNY